MSPQAEAVTSRLRKTWLRWWTFSFWTGVVLAAAASLAVLVVLVLADALLRLPQAVLVALLRGLGRAEPGGDRRGCWSGSGGDGGAWRRPPGGWSWRFPELESHLINIVQFAERDGAVDRPVPAGGRWPRRPRPWRTSRSTRPRPGRAAGAGSCSACRRPATCSSRRWCSPGSWAWPLLCSATVPAWASSTRRVLHPFTFVPSVGSVKIVKVDAGRCRGADRLGPADHRRGRQPRAQAAPRHAVRPPGRQARVGPRRCWPTRRTADVRGRPVPGPRAAPVPAPGRRHQTPALQRDGLREADRRRRSRRPTTSPPTSSGPGETVKQNHGDLEAPSSPGRS